MLSQTIQRSKYFSYLAVMYNLIRRDLKIFKGQFWGKFFNINLILFTTVVVFGYFLPSYGLKSDYGPFLLVGVIASFGFFEVIGKVSTMIADMEGDRTILYTLTLPLPSKLVFVYLAISWAITSLMMSVLMFPLGKLLLFSRFELSKIHLLKLPLILIVSNLFFGFFALWLSAVLKRMSNLSHLFVRVINPMYNFGGWWYSWYTIYRFSPEIGIAHFCNPLLYVMEGMRAAVLGQEGYLPFWVSLAALSGFTLLIGWDAILRLEKRLDSVRS